jgi:hypothetical protein
VNTPVIRRAVGLLATPALALATLAALPAGPSYAAEPDPAPVAAGSAWLESQLTDGLVHGAYPDFVTGEPVNYTDYALSADVALALEQVGETATVDQISTALADNIGAWHHSEWVGTDAGAVAKSLLVAQAAGDDVTSYGGVDLVATLESLIEDDDTLATYGRLRNVGSDYASAISQALAVQGLDALSSPSPALGPATEFLLEQQCAPGWFRQVMSPEDAAVQTCDAASAPSPHADTTAIAVMALQSQLDDTEVAAAVDDAVAWLRTQQHADGSFGGGDEGPNANTTGLAASALHASGDVAAAERAAAWIRAHQLANAGPCTFFGPADLGAIAYNDQAVTAAAADDLVLLTADQYRRASSQALPALRWAPEAPGVPSATAPTGFLRAGASAAFRVAGVDPGEAVCVSGPLTARRQVNATLTGTAGVPVTLPAGTADRVVRATTAEGTDTATLRVLGAKRLSFTLKKTVRKGARQTVRVTGLAPGESVRLFLRGTRVAAGKATPAGVFARTFRVGAKTGSAKVKVLGQFANRTGTKTFRVVR